MATTTVAKIKVTTTVTTTVATTATTIIEITKIATVDSTSTESSKKGTFCYFLHSFCVEFDPGSRSK